MNSNTQLLSMNHQLAQRQLLDYKEANRFLIKTGGTTARDYEHR